MVLCYLRKRIRNQKPKKEKKVPVMKVGTHKKTVIALWLVLIASISFGVYKNFTAIDMHTVHEKEVIEQRIVDTNRIENFVKAFAKSYYSWSNTQESIDKRTAAINNYLTKSLQDLNVDTVRQDIPHKLYGNRCKDLGYRTGWNRRLYRCLLRRSDGNGG